MGLCSFFFGLLAGVGLTYYMFTSRYRKPGEKILDVKVDGKQIASIDSKQNGGMSVSVMNHTVDLSNQPTKS